MGKVNLASNAKTLFVFEAAARTGSFSAAAREFNVTQPSVSRNIAQLEEGLGIRLFDRTSAGISLTPEGAEVYRAVHSGFDIIAQAVDAAIRKASKSRVTLSFSSSFATHWLVPRLRDFKTRFPDVELRLDLVQGMLQDPPTDADISTRVVAANDERYHIWPFAPEIILPVCSPDYLRDRGPLENGTLDRHDFLNLNEEHHGHWAMLLGPEVRPGDIGAWHRFSDYSVAIQTAENGEGIALGWVSVVARAMRMGTLVRAANTEIRTGRWHSLIAHRNRPLRPEISVICEWLTALMAEDLAKIIPVR